jgi:glycosyltransferase involved in cell wall biosynthesis
MRIAQVAPLFESVPPRAYGGSERVVSYLTEELVRQGHHVTLFASGDSVTSAELVPCIPAALRLDPTVRDPIPHYMLMLDKVRERAHEFDILHFHIDYFHFPIFRPMAKRTLTTLHGRLDIPDLRPLYRTINDMPLVAISDAQRKLIPTANFAATVHHGIPLDLHRPTFEPRGRYLAFLGRICPEKRPDLAIKIARACGIQLKIAAKIDRVDEPYFRDVLAPLLDGRCVEYVGEINERTKTAFLGEAAALLFPIDWPEPFGLVMIEAKALPRVSALDRRAVRRRLEQRFSATRMARNCVELYRSLLKRSVHGEVDGRKIGRRCRGCRAGQPSPPRRAFLCRGMACKISGSAAGMVNGRSAIRRAGATIPV